MMLSTMPKALALQPIHNYRLLLLSGTSLAFLHSRLLLSDALQLNVTRYLRSTTTLQPPALNPPYFGYAPVTHYLMLSTPRLWATALAAAASAAGQTPPDTECEVGIKTSPRPLSIAKCALGYGE